MHLLVEQLVGTGYVFGGQPGQYGVDAGQIGFPITLVGITRGLFIRLQGRGAIGGEGFFGIGLVGAQRRDDAILLGLGRIGIGHGHQAEDVAVMTDHVALGIVELNDGAQIVIQQGAQQRIEAVESTHARCAYAQGNERTKTKGHGEFFRQRQIVEPDHWEFLSATGMPAELRRMPRYRHHQTDL